MPNFKLGDHYQRIIKENVNKVLANYVQGFTNNFPLTHEEVQSCIVSRDLLSQFEMLWAAGARTINRSSGVTCLLDRDMTEGLKRHCVLVLHSSGHDDQDGFFTACEAQPYMWSSDPVQLRGHITTCDLRGLPADRVDAVVVWAHALIRASRLHIMVNATVSAALVLCTSTAHLMALWPELASFAKEDATLRKRLAAAPAKLERYTTYTHLMPAKKQRDAANVVLTMGAMALPSAKNTDEAEVKGNMFHFEKLPTDPTF